MSKFKIVMVSKDDKFSLSEKDFAFTLAFPGKHELDIRYVSNNSKPLAEVYNTYLKEHRENAAENLAAEDFIIFMHSDVKLDIHKLLDHVVECQDKYDVMGLCGCTTFVVSVSPLNWYCGSRPCPEGRWGCVQHGELGNQQSYFSAHHPQELDHEVACIDGLCIIFGPKALNDSRLQFDPQFTFNQYDTDISMQTVLTCGLKLGVLVQMDLQHYSVGKSILQPEFLVGEKLLRQKWDWNLEAVNSVAPQ